MIFRSTRFLSSIMGMRKDGVDDEAYFHNNADQYAEVYVKAGEHVLTLQANLDGNMESVKPDVLNLATALVE